MPRVLVVEDSPTQAQQIQFLLEEAGHEAVTAANGREALEVLGRGLPDIVVTDLEMPEMNGLQLVEAVRRTYPGVPVVLMTAHGSEEIAALALRKGAASYVPKYYLEQDLVPTLEKLLAVTKAERQYQKALEFLAEDQCRFVLPNDQAVITPVIGHLVGMLTRLGLADPNGLLRVSIALREALTNAIDHGNLEASSELRQEDDQQYTALLRQRQGAPPYRDRRVHFLARVTPAEVTFVIRDEGPGFDPASLPDPTDPANLERIGGRGLLLVRTFMDQVSHNAQGNEITLVKRREG